MPRHGDHTRPIPGIIVAAGRSIRMGEPKALLPIAPGGPTFVAQIAASLLDGGTASVLVVGRVDDDPLRREVDGLDARVRFVRNPHADTGQLSSVLAGLEAADAPDVDAVLVTPVDAPLVRSSTVGALLAAFRAGGTAIVRATYGGRHGHPVIFGRAVFDELRHADPARGAKAVVHAHAHDLVDLEVDDPGVVHDIDRPDDYWGVFGARGPTD